MQYNSRVNIFDGRAEAHKLDEKIRLEIAKKAPQKRLCIIMVGEDEPSLKYVSMKRKLCEGFDIPVEVSFIDEKLSDEEITHKVKSLCNDSGVGGVIIQLPLPRPSLDSLLSLIPVEKDVDLISPASSKKFYSNDFSKLSPVVRAFKLYMDHFQINPKNLVVTIIGKGVLVGEPLGHYLLQQGAKVQYALDYKTGQALNCQLLVSSAGSPCLVRGESLPKDCNVVDFGSAVLNSITIGDFDLKTTISHLGNISPSPGGMGPLVTRFLVMNFLGI